MRPKLAARLPVCPQAFVMGNCILNNQSFYALGVRQDHSETHRPAIILHVKCVAREPERFGKPIHDVGVVIECVSELFGIRPIAVSEARVARSYPALAIREGGGG